MYAYRPIIGGAKCIVAHPTKILGSPWPTQPMAHSAHAAAPFPMLGVLLQHSTTKFNPFARSWFYNATAVRGALWWLRQSYSVNYANHQHSPFARRRHDVAKTPFPRYHLVKVSWKSVQPFPRTVVSYFLRTEKKTKKNRKKICKTYTLLPHRRLRKLYYSLFWKTLNATQYGERILWLQ